MNTKKVLWILFAVFVVFFIVQAPDDAANIFHNLGHGIGHMFDRITEFVKNLS